MSPASRSAPRRRNTAPPRTASSAPLTIEYWTESQRPLVILCFLLPLIIAYELALIYILRADGSVLTNVAHKNLLDLFDTYLGLPLAGSLYLGGVLIIVVLLIWHFLAMQPWRARPAVLGIMVIETVILTVPLLVFAQIVAAGLTSEPVAAGTPVRFEDLDLLSRLAISIGAGLYEELLFRMVLILLIHTLLHDLLGASSRLAAAIAIVVSASLFVWYHPQVNIGGEFSWRAASFYFIAGLYFGLIFVSRGFGIVVGVHALYDIVTSILLIPNSD